MYYDVTSFDCIISCVGDCSVISNCEHTAAGELRVGGQEHFYFEPQSCIIIPTG